MGWGATMEWVGAIIGFVGGCIFAIAVMAFVASVDGR